jgi:signal transduction histidine kinase
MYHYAMVTVIQKIALFVAFLIVGGALVWWMGNNLVGRPVKALVGQAHEVGRGNLNMINDLEGTRDEIGALAGGLNQMVVDLRNARDRLEQETTQRLAAVEQLNHAERLSTIGKLASGLAHELGTPLNVVAGRAKMIADGGISHSEIGDSARVIRQQAERMTGLIRKLLDFARRSPHKKQVESLSHLAEQAVNLLSQLADGRSASIVLESSRESPVVKADPAQIQQVLSNLIINAIHAMPDGGTVTVRYGVRQVQPPADHGGIESDYAYVDIVDEGVGIPEEDLTRIFTPFFSTKQVGEGTGLGLSIVHGIVNEHDGWITVKSEVGQGSTFSIYLPVEGNES